MTTIADASDMPLWGWPETFFWFAAIVLVATAVLVIVVTARPHNVRLEPSELSAWDRRDMPRCELRCGNAGTITRVHAHPLGGRVVRVCPGHSDEGTIKGWWA